MLRLALALPAVAYGAAHGATCPTGYEKKGTNGKCPAGTTEDKTATAAPTTAAATTAAPASSATTAAAASATTAAAGAATTAAATATTAAAAATTAAPAATTAAPAAATTAAPAGNASNSSRVLYDVESFDFPILRKLDAHAAACPCKKNPAAANNTNGTAAPRESKVTTTLEVEITLDLADPKFTPTVKKAIGNSLAYGIHISACNGVKSIWSANGGKMKNCLLSEGLPTGVQFDMAMSIDAKLGATTYSCIDGTGNDCYGGKMPADRRLAAEKLKSSGDFTVAAKGDAALKHVDEAKTMLDTAKASGATSTTAIAAAATAALARPAMNATFVSAGLAGTLMDSITKAFNEMKVTTTVSAVVTPAGQTAPATTTSGAFTNTVSAAFFLIAGALLM